MKPIPKQVTAKKTLLIWGAWLLLVAANLCFGYWTGWDQNSFEYLAVTGIGGVIGLVWSRYKKRFYRQLAQLAPAERAAYLMQLHPQDRKTIAYHLKQFSAGKTAS